MTGTIIRRKKGQKKPQHVRNKEVPKPKLALITITPAKAKKMLATMGANRNLNQQWVNTLARDIKAGRWVVNGDTIRFMVNGQGKPELIDGQHRLHAVILADTEIQSFVANDLPEGAMDSVDTNRTRTFANMLQIDGRRYTTCASAVTQMLWQLDKGIQPGSKKKAARASHSDLRETYERHPKIQEMCAKSFCQPFLAPHSCIAFCFYLFWQKNKGQAEEWMKDFATGENLKAGDPVMTVRNKFIRLRSADQHARPTRSFYLAMLIKSWNYRREGVQPKRFNWRDDEDDFPKVK